MELSIVVPVYNVEKYLDKCLESLAEQTLDNNCYEILVVNDGSPDNSQEIIDRYAAQYTNIISLQKSNGGLSDARNYGLGYAKGRYIAFVDSDDYVRNDMYEKMLKKAKEQDFDMVVCDFVEVYEDREVVGTSRVQEDLLNKDVVRHAMLDFYPSAWNKLYKRELFEHVKFKKGIWFEDVEFLYRLLPLVTSVGVVKESFYMYMQRTGSISKSADSRIFHCLENWNGLIEYYRNNNYMMEYDKEFEFCYVRYIYATFIKAALKFDKDNFEIALSRAIEGVKQNFKNYRRNPYFYRSFKGVYCVLFSKVVGELLYLVKGNK